MTLRTAIMKIVQQDAVSFTLTNRIPRRLATRLVGWFSRIENPVVCAASLAIWRMFTTLDLEESRDRRFASMHACFTRRLRPGARPADPAAAVLTSPCDGIVGSAGVIAGADILQVKGSPYALADLLDDPAHAASLQGGCYVTLRLTSAMYHRFHAPHDCRVEAVTHIFGDAWNVNPATLRRVPRVFCRNERAVIRTTLLETGHAITLVPVAAILVAGIRLAFADLPWRRSKGSRTAVACDVTLQKGDEMGWFEHGSTILVFAPAGVTLDPAITLGTTIRAGQALMHLPRA